MTLAAAFALLDEALAASRAGVRDGSLLAPAAAACLGMVTAYRADAAAFADRGDPVNALAAVAYASGWLDAAITVGLLNGRESEARVLRSSIPGCDLAHLEEKTRRYAAMLEAALEAAGPAPDPASPAHAAALAVLAVAGAFLAPAAALLADGDLEASLSVSSYAYGWLDAGVRAGLLAIAGDRSLFAV
ncbi:MAG: DUF357 domain-containing protein [Methanospirillum sp.]